MSDSTPKKKAYDELVQLSPPGLLQELRRIVQPKGVKSSWVGKLSDARLLEVYYRGKRGQSANSIAKMCQVEWGIMRTSATKSLARSVKKFLDRAVGVHVRDEYQTPERKKTVADHKKKMERFDKDFDLLKHYRFVIQQNLERFAMWRDKENIAKMPMKGADNTTKTLLEAMNSYAQLAIRMGVMDAKPSEFNLTIRKEFEALMKIDSGNMDDFVAKFIENTRHLTHQMVKTEDGKLLMAPKSGEGEVIDITPKEKEEDDDENA